jgi:hypothetical protein
MSASCPLSKADDLRAILARRQRLTLMLPRTRTGSGAALDSLPPWLTGKINIKDALANAPVSAMHLSPDGAVLIEASDGSVHIHAARWDELGYTPVILPPASRSVWPILAILLLISCCAALAGAEILRQNNSVGERDQTIHKQAERIGELARQEERLRENLAQGEETINKLTQGIRNLNSRENLHLSELAEHDKAMNKLTQDNNEQRMRDNLHANEELAERDKTIKKLNQDIIDLRLMHLNGMTERDRKIETLNREITNLEISHRAEIARLEQEKEKYKNLTGQFQEQAKKPR